MGVLSQNLFTLIVTMAIVTTMAMPPMLRWALKRLPMRKKERIRLEREELDAKSFVTNLERLLLAADDSPNGKFASRLAGVIAGSGGKPTTIVDMSKEDRGAKAAAKANGKEAKEKVPKETVETAAEGIDTLESHPDEEKPGNVDVTARSDKPKGPHAIAEEARKGYDFMVVGIAKTRNPNGGFSKDISLITNGFEGPLAVVDAHEPRRDRLPRRYGKILIPVNGTEVSRRAAEIGLTLARANDAQVTALFVTRANGGGKAAQRAGDPQGHRRTGRPLRRRRAQHDTGEPGARGRHRPRSQARLRSRRPWRQPAARRYAVFRRYRRVGARTLGYVKSICGELRRCDRIVIAESNHDSSPIAGPIGLRTRSHRYPGRGI
jgi:nucleotide-binding universal stress UspA family protein